MPKIISFDMDGTLVDPEFTDWVWLRGIPELFAQQRGIPFDEAKALVIKEYQTVGEGAIEWYDIKYWFRRFQFDETWETLMRRYVDKIKTYEDVPPLLEYLKAKYPLVLTSNAGREFIHLVMETTGLERYFNRIFSATSDFQVVKKTPHFYQQICDLLGVEPKDLVHVGDHYEFDYLAPQALGIKAFYLDRTGQGNGDSVLFNLRDLVKRLFPLAEG